MDRAGQSQSDVAESDSARVRRELRVLDGVHAGARAAMEDGQASMSIGRTIEHDIVLRDSPCRTEGATVALHPGGWTWRACAGADALTLPLGTALRFGSAVITIDDEQTPWPDVAALAVIEPAVANTAVEDPPSAGPPSSSESDGMPTPPAETTALGRIDSAAGAAAPNPNPSSMAPRPDPAPRERPARGRALPLAGISAIVAVAAVAAVATRATMEGSTLSTTAPRTSPAALPPAGADSIRAMIGAAHLGDSLDVRGERPGRFEVVGVVDDDAQRDALRERLSTLKPVPLSNVLTRSEFGAEVDAEARTLDPGLALTVEGRAGLRLGGVVRDARDIDVVVRRIAADLPAALHLVQAVQTAADVVAQFSTELAQRGLPMHARLVDGRMIVDGTLAREGLAQWESLIRDFNRRYGDHLAFYAKFDDAPGAAAAAASGPGAAAPAADTGWLPRIASVVGGDAPFLVLADGRKVMPGGTLNGYELSEIRGGSLVLRTARGSSREVPR